MIRLQKINILVTFESNEYMILLLYLYNILLHTKDYIDIELENQYDNR